MSTEWYPVKRIPWEEFLTFKSDVIKEAQHDTVYVRQHKCLTDGKAYVWAIETRNQGTMFEAFGRNQDGREETIIKAIEQFFNTTLISLYGPYSDQWDIEQVMARERKHAQDFQ